MAMYAPRLTLFSSSRPVDSASFHVSNDVFQRRNELQYAPVASLSGTNEKLVCGVGQTGNPGVPAESPGLF
jgi:hypothetical protein